MPDSSAQLLALGAHPDDIEFGCGGVIARETQLGRKVHFVVCSRGESASHGSTDQRTREAQESAALLGATLEFLDLGVDAHLEVRITHVLALAGVLRRVRPRLVLAPAPVENQHPDHARLGQMVRDAARLARYAGVAELREQPAHVIDGLLYYAITPDAEPADLAEFLIDVSAPEVLARWTAAMRAHVSQAATRDYVELQLTRARLHGCRAGVGHAVPLFANDPPIFDSLAPLTRTARHF